MQTCLLLAKWRILCVHTMTRTDFLRRVIIFASCILYTWLEVRVAVMATSELSLAAIASSITVFRSFPLWFSSLGVTLQQETSCPVPALAWHSLGSLRWKKMLGGVGWRERDQCALFGLILCPSPLSPRNCLLILYGLCSLDLPLNTAG